MVIVKNIVIRKEVDLVFVEVTISDKIRTEMKKSIEKIGNIIPIRALSC